VVLSRVQNQFATLVDTAQGTDLPEAWVSAHPFASNAEAVGVPDLAKDLLQLIDTGDGLNRLRWLIELFVTNPYPRYRDLALVALGRVCVGVPDPVEARGCMQSILRAALDQEGITFTFDLPSLLLAEATRRGLPAPDLVAYLDEAKRMQDRWTTPVRIQSATALAEHYLGRAGDAEQRLRDAHQQLDGYAGFSVLAALSLANRWCEFGKSQDLEVQALVGRADQEARRVRDPKFSEDRFMLVQRYRNWLNQGPPSLETALGVFAVMQDADERTTYVDYISACWSVTGPLPQLDWLKAFVASSLGDGTRLDGVLARLVGHRLASRTNDQLIRTMDICARQLATAKPWAAPKMVGPG
jgi:hypothetical protein